MRHDRIRNTTILTGLKVKPAKTVPEEHNVRLFECLLRMGSRKNHQDDLRGPFGGKETVCERHSEAKYYKFSCICNQIKGQESRVVIKSQRVVIKRNPDQEDPSVPHSPDPRKKSEISIHYPPSVLRL
ncbi:unnamed protein product [Nezara viridula]|uniref:Uncharacterized protein n=1 Tax=Nezara viridula TaxID=85310 RepID=A0A9P0MP55_NEZVI|nr:unnamed protein product [Nezara viridula]